MEQPMARDPYCSNCGYSLIGLTDSSKCPECGKPLVEVLIRRGDALPQGKRYKSALTIFGLPLVHIAVGPYEDERRGRARGIIAIGDVATGFLAIGTALATGIIAIGGGAAVGIVALGGGAAIGLLTVASLAIGGLAFGGAAIGGIAIGGGAAGYIAVGGGAVGQYANGGGVAGTHVVGPMVRDPAAVALFNRLAWLLGPMPPPRGIPLAILGWALAGAIAVAAATALLVLLGYLLGGRRDAHGRESP